jgi:hypothetical protein
MNERIPERDEKLANDPAARTDADGAPTARQPFAKPMLTKHGSVAKVTEQFAGTFSP